MLKNKSVLLLSCILPFIQIQKSLADAAGPAQNPTDIQCMAATCGTQIPFPIHIKSIKELKLLQRL